MVGAIVLWFGNNQLERAYVEHRVNNDLLQIDKFGTFFQVFVASLVTLQRYNTYGLCKETVRPLVVLAVMAFIHWGVIFWLRRRAGLGWCSIRTAVAIPYRLVAFPVLPIVLRTWWLMLEVADTDALGKFALQRCGLLISLTMAFFVPLLLKYHIPIQAIGLYGFTRFVTPQMCEAAVRPPAGKQLFLWAWKWMDSLSWKILAAMYLTRVGDVTHPAPVTACVQISTWWSTTMGFVVPTYCIWLWEHVSRTRFLRTYPLERGTAGRDQALLRLRSSDIPLHLGLVVVALAILWQALFHPAAKVGAYI